jgi:histone H3/H4
MEASNAGMALQNAIEAIVEQTVEKTVNRMAEKGEKV